MRYRADGLVREEETAPPFCIPGIYCRVSLELGRARSCSDESDWLLPEKDIPNDVTSCGRAFFKHTSTYLSIRVPIVYQFECPLFIGSSEQVSKFMFY